MTVAELITKYVNTVAGPFRVQAIKAITPGTFRTFVTDILTVFASKEDTIHGVLVKDAEVAKDIEASGTYIHAGPGAEYTLADDVKELRVTNDITSTGLLKIRNSAGVHFETINKGITMHFYWDGDKHQTVK